MGNDHPDFPVSAADLVCRHAQSLLAFMRTSGAAYQVRLQTCNIRVAIICALVPVMIV